MRFLFGIIVTIGLLLLLAGVVTGYSIRMAVRAKQEKAALLPEIVQLRAQLEGIDRRARDIAEAQDEFLHEFQYAQKRAEERRDCDWPAALAADSAPSARRRK